MLSGDLEEWLERRLSPTVVYQYPTIAALAEHLAAATAAPETAVAPSSSAVPQVTLPPDDAVAVVGLGCRFPGVDNPREFWRLLSEGVDAIGEIPAERWNLDAFYDPEPGTPGKMYTRWGGFLRNADQFDPQFFGISPREAMRTDPQQRLLLEVAWEALEDAGYAPDSLSNSETGVFVGISSNDYSLLQQGDYASIDAYTGTGNAFSIAANRLSYLLNLHGPSMAIDTACSSSLVAIHLACRSLRSGEADVALAGGVNLILSPELNITFSHARMMSPTGRCRTFDADADGYVRGEGCGVVVLKRLADAQRDGDNILAIVRGAAVNHDGRSNGITAPNSQAQQRVIQRALQDAELSPEQIGYIEAHGTGTKLGDPIEVEALGAVLRGRSLNNPCLLGSVKTNIGHLEAAAGIAGFIKTVLMLQSGELPPHLHFQQINPYIALDELPLEIVTERRPWPSGSTRRFAGVSSFGFGGTNAHVILEEAPPQHNAENKVEREEHLLVLSAQDEQALTQLAGRYADYLATDPAVSLPDVAFTANTGRSHFDHRLAVAAATAEAMHAKLAAFAAGERQPDVHLGQKNGRPPKLAFLFTGQGAQYVGMGRGLYETQPVFRNALEQCAAILHDHLERPLLDVLFAASGSPDAALLDETAYTQPALFAIEYSLAQLWQSWGVTPDVVMGHSVGEYVAACLAGVFSLEDGLKLIAARGRLMQSLPHDGAMAVIFADAARVTAAFGEYAGQIDVAAANGPSNTVISGAEAAVAAVAAQLEAEGVTTRSLTVSHAFHSPLMEPILDEFRQVAQTVQFNAPALPFVSNLTGELVTAETPLDAAYWQRHIRHAVQFAAGMEALAAAGCTVFLEVGPHPSLVGMGRRCFDPDFAATWLASLHREEANWSTILNTLAVLYTSGWKIDWASFDDLYARRKVQLPTYPFQRSRYWVDAQVTSRQTAVARHRVSTGVHPLLGQRLPSPLQVVQYESQISIDEQFSSGRSNDQQRLSPAVYLEMALAAAVTHYKQPRVALTQLTFTNSDFSTADSDQTVQLILSPNSAALEVFKLNDDQQSWTRLVHGLAGTAADDEHAPEHISLTALRARLTSAVAAEHYTPALGPAQAPLVHQLFVGNSEALARLAGPTTADYHVGPALLETGFQLLALLHDDSGAVYEATAVDRFSLYDETETAAWVHLTLRRNGSARPHGNLHFFTERGALLATAENVELKLLENVVRESARPQPAATPAPMAEASALTAASLRSLAPEEQWRHLEAYLRARLAAVLRLDAEQIDVQRPINFFGLDSIMAIELKNSVEKALQLDLPIATLLQGPNLTQLTAELLQQVEAGAPAAEPKIKAADAGPGEYPLSYGQRALWVQHHIDRGSVFNPTYAVRIASAVDVDELRAAFQTLVDRHAALRTTFASRKGEPVQIVAAHADVHFVHEDGTGWSDDLLRERLETEAYRPFDLENGPLFRVTLFSRGNGDHTLLLAAHHIVSDLWSLAVLISELSHLLTAGADADLPPLPLAYTDYARWHTDMLAGAEGEDLWAYWRNKLAGPLPLLELPTDKPRPAVQTHNGASRSLQLDAELTRELEAISERYGVTLYVTLLAAFKVLLYDYTRQEDLIVGTPTTGRSLSQLTDLVGYFVNPVALRSQVNGRLRFGDFLQQVQHTVVEAIAHQDYPIAKLAEKLQPDRDASHLPIFQVMFIMQRAHLLYDEGLSKMSVGTGGMQMTLGDLELESVAIEERVAPFDLTLMVAPADDKLAASLTYSTDLYEAESIGRMLEHFKTLLAGIVADPERPIADLPLLSDEELHQLLVQFNDTTRRSPALAQRVHDLFTARAEETPDALAVVFGQQQLTYSELDGRANQLAHYLRRSGVGPETIVAISVERSVEMVVGLLGILKAGGAYLPLDPAYPRERLAFMLADAGVSVLLTQEKLLELPAIADFGARVTRSNTPHPRPAAARKTSVVCLDRDWPTIARESRQAPQSEVLAENLAYVIYTSGSTGWPKGVLLTHRGLTNLVQAQTEAFGVNGRSHVLQFASFSFDASVSEIFMALLKGGTLHLAPREKLAAINELHRVLRDEAITTVTLPPSVLATLPKEGLSRLRTIISAGEACTPEVVRRWAEKGRQFFNAYGPTEATIGPTLYPVKTPLNGATRVPIGYPIANIQIYLLDEQLRPVPIGVPGEIFIGGFGLARGYLNRADLTAEKFLPNPFSEQPGARLYKTGDLARHRPDGSLEFLGRIDHQVKLRGFRIELGEIEAALAQHNVVQDCAAIVREDTPGDQRLVAYVVAGQRPKPNTSKLRAFLQDRLPDYMVPAHYIVLEALPRTPNGKVDRDNLPAPTSERPDLENAYVMPRNDTERRLAAVWQEVLGLDRVGIYDNFFDLGGHSLLVAKAHSRMLEQFGDVRSELSLVELFKYPTIRALAEHLAGDDEEQSIVERSRVRARQQREAIKELRKLRKQSWKKRSFFQD